MGIGRKVGAFLGLVPEDHRQYADGDDYADEYERDYRSSSSFDGPSYDRDDRDDRGSERAADRGYGSGKYDEKYDDDYDRYPARPTAGVAGGGGRRYHDDAPTQGALAVKAVTEPISAIRREDTSSAGRPSTVKLTGFGEARVIGEKYREGQSVILDMTQMSDSDARRLVDFSAGLAFSLRGSIEKVAPKVFMLLPPDADVAAATAGYQNSFAGR
ncbi:DUF552 domain-containing protein [Nakamurella sp. YIM 132087]|uniref:Cell division protein SepF n=1 Tax=Nakamurella alba TaxID=2665158 RepID=A0A7K1FQU8_9ACTN|nr:cell division protein SepF [Nakamurella alba]MTD16506.1 DUF552 domain-containing protein [Nakamurella alba]